MIFQNKKAWLLFTASIVTLSGCNGGGGSSSAPAPNSITAVSTVINGNWNGGSSTINKMTIGASSSLSAINSNGQIWQAVYFAHQNLLWESLAVLPDQAVPSTIAVNGLGILYAGGNNGYVYTYSNGSWASLGLTTSSSPTSMVISNSNHTYLGNLSGGLWYYDNISWTNNLSNGGFSSSGSITQLILDSVSNPQYLGVATGTYAWACQLSGNDGNCSQWVNMIQEAINNGWYTDSGSTVNAMSLYQDTSTSVDYGYIGNSYGHVWQAVYQLSSASVQSFAEMTNNPNFPGFPANAGAITSIASDSSNNLYVGTANGELVIWTTSTHAWSTITPSQSTSAITSLVVLNSSTTNGVLFAGNASGQIWEISWQ